MRSRIIGLCLAITLLLPSPARAQAVSSLSLRDALAEARRANPELVALQRQYESVLATIPQSGSLDPPMFEAQVWGWPVNTINPSRTDMYMFSAEQELPGRGKRTERQLVASRDADLSQRSIAVHANAILNEVKQAYAELLLARATTELYRQQAPVLADTADAATVRYASGRSGQNDTVKTVVELSRLQADAIQWRERARVAETALNALLGRPVDTPVPELAPIDAGLPALVDAERLALERNPELAMATAEVAREEAELARLRGERRPDFVVGGGYMLQPGAAGAWTARGGITWPNAPWSRGRLNAGIDAQEKRLAAARARKDAVASSVRRMVQEAVVHVEAARDRVKVLESSVVPRIEHAFEVARVAYAADRGEFGDLLDTQRLLLSTRMDIVAARADLARAAADLELALGDVVEEQ